MDPEQGSSLAMPRPQMDFGVSSVPVMENLGKARGEKRRIDSRLKKQKFAAGHAD